MKSIIRRIATVVAMAASVAIPLAGVASASPSAAADAHQQSTVAGVTYMGSTRDLGVCHSTGLWYVTNGHATYYYCQEYYDAATGRWYALYLGV